jgi:hypothetical protein
MTSSHSQSPSGHRKPPVSWAAETIRDIASLTEDADEFSPACWVCPPGCLPDPPIRNCSTFCAITGKESHCVDATSIWYVVLRTELSALASHCAHTPPWVASHSSLCCYVGLLARLERNSFSLVAPHARNVSYSRAHILGSVCPLSNTPCGIGSSIVTFH